MHSRSSPSMGRVELLHESFWSLLYDIGVAFSGRMCRKAVLLGLRTSFHSCAFCCAHHSAATRMPPKTSPSGTTCLSSTRIWMTCSKTLRSTRCTWPPLPAATRSSPSEFARLESRATWRSRWPGRHVLGDGMHAVLDCVLFIYFFVSEGVFARAPSTSSHSK